MGSRIRQSLSGEHTVNRGPRFEPIDAVQMYVSTVVVTSKCDIGGNPQVLRPSVISVRQVYFVVDLFSSLDQIVKNA